MLTQLSTVIGGLYGAVGPGLLLAAALPFSLTLMVLVIREALGRLDS